MYISVSIIKIIEEKDLEYFAIPMKGDLLAFSPVYGAIVSDMKGSKTYVYALKDADGVIVKVGKSIRPKGRLIDYNLPHHTMEILEIYEDRENYWIKKLLKEGHELQNREMNIEVENWDVGDIIQTGKKKTYTVKDRKTNITYPSIYKLHQALNKEGTVVSLSVLTDYLMGRVKNSTRLTALALLDGFRVL